jgi:Cu+-exporting ATPase
MTTISVRYAFYHDSKAKGERPLFSNTVDNMTATIQLEPYKTRGTAQYALCYHCHEAIKPQSLICFADKSFCCEGCKTVFQILNENDLCAFYQLDAEAGLNQRDSPMWGARGAEAYAYLDDAQVAAQLVDYQDDATTRVTFLLPQIHCVSCIWLLENLHRLNTAVYSAKVNFLKRNITLLFDNQKTTLRQVAETLATIGYAPDIKLQDTEGVKPPATDRTLYYKLGLAGFAFGNIMLLSFPEYLGLKDTLDHSFSPFLGYLNLLLATPVLLYSARDYLTSAIQSLKDRRLNIDVPLALGIVALYGRSAFEILSHTDAGYMDSFAGLIFFLLTGKWFQQYTFSHISFERDYKSYFPVAAQVKTAEGKELSTPLSKLAVNDTIIIRNGELIPADGILLKGQAQIDYSFVTGEADAVSKSSGDKVFAGGRQMGSAIEIAITRRVSQSYLTGLWNNEAFKTQTKSSISYLADRAGRYFTGVILLVSMVAFLFWLPQDMGKAINAATAVLIVACPCAVALAIPFTLGNLLRLLGRYQFYLKNTNVLEQFERVEAVVFDKTGTLTARRDSQIQFVGQLNDSEKQAVMSLAAESNHPLSIQVFQYLEKSIAPPIQAVSAFEEMIGKGVQGIVNQKLVALGSSEFVKADTDKDRQGRGVFVAIEGQVKGYFDIKARYREGFQTVIQFFQDKGKSVYLLSGDNDHERDFLAQYFLTTHNPITNNPYLHFNQSPLDKLAFIKTLQAQGKKVLMFGDGLNDAGALQQADLGVVISENTNNFSPACDAILAAHQFSHIPRFFQIAREGSVIVNRAYLIAFCYNLVGLSYAVSGTLSPVVAAILMPLSSVSIVLFGVLMGHWVLRRERLFIEKRSEEILKTTPSV